MPKAKIVYYCEEDGRWPVSLWLDTLDQKAQKRCEIALNLLEAFGHELRRPHTDYLRDGIYELRVKVGNVHYRILYFFHGRIAAVVSHGITKEQRIPDIEIDRTLFMKKVFESNPERHSNVLER